MGQHFFITTYHFRLKYLFNKRITTIEQQHLLMKLMPFDFTIVYKAGNENKGDDVLSHHSQHADLLTVAMLVSLDFSTLREALQPDSYT